MNRLRPFVVLPFPQGGRARVSRGDSDTSTNAGIVPREARPLVKCDRAVRFFQDIHGLVYNGGRSAPAFVVCANGRGLPSDQVTR